MTEDAGAGGADRQDAGLSPVSLAALGEIPLAVEVRVGSTELTLAQLLECGAGTVLELDASADSMADLLIGGQPVARGELVAVDGRLGIRIVEVVNSDEDDG
ncbi:MAG: FliM/FliN family flagellar motor switch protein [Armatimonadota bacterium]